MDARALPIRFALATLVALATSAPAAALPTLIPLDFAPLAVSADGSVVVGSKRVGGVTQAVRWVNGVAQVGGFQPPSGPALTSWNDVSADGTVMIGGTWLYSSGQWTELPFAPNRLSGDGTTVLGIVAGRVTTWKNGVTTTLPPFIDPDLQQLSAGAISYDGTVMGGALFDGDPFDPDPGLWLNRGLGYLELPMQNNFKPYLGISPDGSTLGGQNNGRPVLWEDGVLTQLAIRHAIGAWITNVTDGGELAFGGECVQTAECTDLFGIPGPGLTSENVVWHEGQITSLLAYLAARGVTADAIVGDANFSQVVDLGDRGRAILVTSTFGSQGWLATNIPVPEPGTAPLVAAGLAALALRRRSRTR